VKVLLLNQCFYPDGVATAQYLTDLAVELKARGHDVTVIASRRAYDNPGDRFPARETHEGIKIIRIATLGLGKQAKWRRGANFASFLACCLIRLLFTPRHDVVVALTSPPLISFLGSLFVKLKGGRFYFWVMDLNPDEAIVAGWLKENSLTARVLRALLQYSLRHSEKVFVLDRFMKQRVGLNGIAPDRLLVVPPWARAAISFDEDGRKAFRAEHDLTGKFVVMYAGNHSPCHPLDTLLAAAEGLAVRPEIVFCFIGGGSEQSRVRRFAAARNLQNIRCLPYQSPYEPFEQLSAALSAADMQVVVMGDPFVGIVHPCKIYNILTIGAPLLYIGPSPSHVTDILANMLDGVDCYSARQGDTDGVSTHILVAIRRNTRVGNARRISAEFSCARLLPQMVAAVEANPDSLTRPASANA